jgi:hypothetical protein
MIAKKRVPPKEIVLKYFIEADRDQYFFNGIVN